jgi:sarcosine oxidase subunit beta
VHDVAIIGGGIIGASAATFLAEAGVSVVLFEQSAIGAGASGRNSGVLQHPYDPLLAELHQQTLALYRQLAELEPEFELPAVADGLLLVAPDGEAASARADLLRATAPELRARLLEPAELARLEPTLTSTLWGVLLATGFAVPPSAATQAFVRRARRAGAEIRVGEPALPVIAAGRAVGVRVGSGQIVAAGGVLVAAGPWSARLVPGWSERSPISRLWGVVASVELDSPPRLILEEVSIDVAGSAEPLSFSLVTAGGTTSLGSTFLSDEPQPDSMAQPLVERGQRFVPRLRGARVTALRACARPISFDARPLIGGVASIERLFVCAGHGPWGISTGPASALIVARLMLGQAVNLPAALRATRH